MIKISEKQIKNQFKISVARIAILGMFLALLITLKYAFGFIAGVEMISFMFIFLGIFLPFIDLVLLIASFNFLIIAIYGFGNWWFAYWIIWPVDAFVSKFISKFTKNKFAFGVWGFFAGFFVFFWYFWSDAIFYDMAYAKLNVISAIPINLIEGFTTMLCCILLAPTMAKIFNIYAPKFWDKKKEWHFKEIKRQKLNIMITSLAIVIIITVIILLFVYNSVFLDMKESLERKNHPQGYIK